jgi:hypothetical protein
MHGTGAILHSAMAGIGRESQNAAHQRYRAVARKSAQKHDALPRLALREKSRPLPGWLRDDAGRFGLCKTPATLMVPLCVPPERIAPLG